jgi:hypothetical protein
MNTQNESQMEDEYQNIFKEDMSFEEPSIV